MHTIRHNLKKQRCIVEFFQYDNVLNILSLKLINIILSIYQILQSIIWKIMKRLKQFKEDNKDPEDYDRSGNHDGSVKIGEHCQQHLPSELRCESNGGDYAYQCRDQPSVATDQRCKPHCHNAI